jgi:hypothetical protein
MTSSWSGPGPTTQSRHPGPRPAVSQCPRPGCPQTGCLASGLALGVVPSVPCPQVCPQAVCRLSVRFQGGPPGRSRRRLGALAFAPAGAPATAAPTPVGWREKHEKPGRLTYSKFHACWRGVPAPAAGIVRVRSEPVKPICDRRATAPVKLHGECTREDGLDRTCPDLELAAIGRQGHEWPGP